MLKHSTSKIRVHHHTEYCDSTHMPLVFSGFYDNNKTVNSWMFGFTAYCVLVNLLKCRYVKVNDQQRVLRLSSIFSILAFEGINVEISSRVQQLVSLII